MVIIVTFGAAWGEYVLSKTLNTREGNRTLPVVLTTGIAGMVAWNWAMLATIHIMVILPGLVAFAVAQRWYMKGLQEGALKV